MHLITGYAGEEHIQSKDQGAFNAAFFGDGQFVMESGSMFEGSIYDNNTVRILDGDGLMYGRHFRIEPNTYEDVTIQTGTAGKNRIDLIVATYSKDGNSGFETSFLQVIKGAETEGIPQEPPYTNGNILDGATLNQMPLYKVSIEGVVLASIEQIFETKPTYAALAEQYAAEFKKSCETHLDSLNILDTMEEIEANTQAGQLAGALVLKEMLTNNKETSENCEAHCTSEENPHKVTKAQVGLGNVPNVATNDQTPTYTAASANANLTSGEKLSVAFGKIAKAISSLISHLSNISNPHSVTKAQVGLGNVDNTADSQKSVKSATSATKATQDGNGNNIVSTYATKASLGTQATMTLSGTTLTITTK